MKKLVILTQSRNIYKSLFINKTHAEIKLSISANSSKHYLKKIQVEKNIETMNSVLRKKPSSNQLYMLRQSERYQSNTITENISKHYIIKVKSTDTHFKEKKLHNNHKCKNHDA